MSKAIVKNPIFFSDVPDVDVLRYNDAYYMVSTTMHVLPGGMIMKSTDLANWKIQSYIFDKIADNDGYELKNGQQIYGSGQWATSLKYYKGMFYAIFVCNNMHKTYIYYTKDIESSNWDRYELDGIYHDPSFLFDDDGRNYVIHGGGDIRIRELKADLSGPLEGGVDQLLLVTEKEGIGLRCEGCHAYKINGYYYLLFIEWPVGENHDGRRREVCYRSKELLGTYERKIVMDDDLGYHNKGVAQGAIFDTPQGEWFSMLFQDHDAVGRIPCIMPVKWENDWPVFGIDGKVPQEFESPFEESEKYEMVINDDFDHEKNELAINWQWNHNPENSKWSFTERPGYLRLTTFQQATSVLDARNTLTQRTEGPKCSAITHIDTTGMKIGDNAGLVALQSNFGTVGVKVKKDGTRHVVMTTKSAEGNTVIIGGVITKNEAVTKGKPNVEESIQIFQNDIYLRIDFDYEDSRDIAEFFYSLDGVRWTKIGCDLKMIYTLDHFMGYRIGLFNYATKETGGYADFEYFKYSIIK